MEATITMPKPQTAQKSKETQRPDVISMQQVLADLARDPVIVEIDRKKYLIDRKPNLGNLHALTLLLVETGGKHEIISFGDYMRDNGHTIMLGAVVYKIMGDDPLLWPELRQKHVDLSEQLLDKLFVTYRKEINLIDDGFETGLGIRALKEIYLALEHHKDVTVIPSNMLYPHYQIFDLVEYDRNVFGDDEDNLTMGHYVMAHIEHKGFHLDVCGRYYINGYLGFIVPECQDYPVVCWPVGKITARRIVKSLK